jgi:prefoldin subunit 5|tara:strand:+ start:651 stop:830 length:180 start_codon:yes stop_codon:yes gene_type:complete
MNTLKIEKLKKRIKSLDNILDNIKNNISAIDESILFELRQEMFRDLTDLKSTARKSIKH